MKIKLSICLGFLISFQLFECLFTKATHPPIWLEVSEDVDRFNMGVLPLPAYRAALEVQTKGTHVSDASSAPSGSRDRLDPSPHVPQVWGENELPIMATSRIIDDKASCHLVTRAAVVSVPYGEDNYYDFIHVMQEGSFSYQDPEERTLVKRWTLKTQPVMWNRNPTPELPLADRTDVPQKLSYQFTALNAEAAGAMSILKSAPPTTASDQTIENSISMGISGSVSFAPTGKTGSITPSFSVSNKRTMKIPDVSIYNRVGSDSFIPKAEWVYKFDNLSRDRDRTNGTSISTLQPSHQWVWRIDRAEAIRTGLYFQKGALRDLFLVLDNQWSVKTVQPTLAGCYSCCCKCCFSFWCSSCDEVSGGTEINLNRNTQLPVIIPIPKLTADEDAAWRQGREIERTEKGEQGKNFFVF